MCLDNVIDKERILMNQIYAIIFCLIFSVNGFAQSIEFSQPEFLFPHPFESNISFNYPVLPLDYNQDGIKDYITRVNDYDIVVYQGDGLGGFDISDNLAYTDAIWTPGVGLNSRPFAIMDFDEDGFDDIILNCYLYIYNPESNDYRLLTLDEDQNLFYIAIAGIGDFNGDGFNDFVTVAESGSLLTDLAIYYWDGLASFSKSPIDNDLDIGMIQVSDLEGDGDDDIAILNDDLLDSPAILVNDGTGNFNQLNVPANTFLYFTKLDFQDFDGDGDSDLLVRDQQSLLIYENSDNYATSPTVYTVTANDIVTTRVIDLNNDGIKEIVSLEFTANDYSVKVYQAALPLTYIISQEIGQFDAPLFALGLNPNYIKNSLSFTNVGDDNKIDIVLTFGAGYEAVYLFENTTDILSSVENQAVHNLLEIYPNPSSKYIILEHPISDGTEQVMIVDASGKLINTISIDSQYTNSRVQLDNYNDGVYFLTYTSKTTQVTRKFVVKSL